MRVSILGSEDNNFFSDGGKEIFDIAGQGRMDAFFLSGAQIDGKANVNLVAVGIIISLKPDSGFFWLRVFVFCCAKSDFI